ncbi:MAG: GGDEF domain-containing phosphodiesterase, partial [Pseudomonadota bacterium]
VLLYLAVPGDRPQTLASALTQDLARPFVFEGRACRCGASIGVASTQLTTVDALLTNSDIALYKAKNAGRAQVGLFDRRDLETLRETKSLADDILRGLEAGEFVPFFQPQVDAKTGDMIGMEALARWDHPTRGILTPDVFLSVATDLNVAAELDRSIFEHAIQHCETAFAAWPRRPSLSFNVSATRISSADVEDIARLATQYSGGVAFELLETIFLEEENAEFLFQLDRLRELGISIEIDDFGSGRASVVALQRIAPDRIKIDRRLVAPMHESQSGMQLLRSITEIGLALDIGVTAEGVETKAQAEELAILGCDRLQGYFFAKPMGLQDVLNTVVWPTRAG